MTGSTVLRIDAAMRGNKVIYWLGRIPLIRRLVSDTLYSAKEGKLALSILLWVWRAIKSFAGTFLYVGVMCVLPLLIVAEPAGLRQEFGRFCWLLFMLSFVTGALLNPCAVASDQLKYTCVRMMGMSAGRYHLAAELKHHLEYFITFTAALVTVSALMGRGALPGLVLSAELSCARLIMEWFHVWAYDRLGRPLFGRTWFSLTVIFAGLAAAYVPGLLLDLGTEHWLLSAPVFLILLAGGVFSVVMLCRYPRYYRLTLDVCTADKVSAEVAQQKSAGAAFQDVRLKDSDLTAEGECANLSGWPYLQALFFRRHSRMMYKPLKYILIGIAAVTVICCVPLLIFRGEDLSELFSHVTAVLPFCVFFLYIIQSNIMGTRITKAMFYNCDLAMLKYGWYRQPGVVLKNFALRFRRLCGVNLLMSGAVCVMFTAMVLCAGGRPPLVDYIAFLIALLCLGVFFAVHSLGMYYLFQPYTSDLKIKNPFFGLVNTVIYILCYACIQIRSTPRWFTPVVLAVTVAYSAVILLLVWKRSPRTFRVK
ncbi:MAG: hypothetical protein ACI4OU_00405 [Candidatus Enterenecus sp.]